MNDKQKIGWHETGYGNWKQSLDKHEERTLQELERIKDDRKRLDFYKFQIDEAKKIGKEEFDRKRYKVKRKPLAEGMKLPFKVPSQSSDKPCLTDSKSKPLTDSKYKIMTGKARL